MKPLTFFVTVCILMTCSLTTVSYGALVEELFRDDFDGDLAEWGCQDRDWAIGQTWFKGCPEVHDSMVTFTHHTYNQYDPSHQSCLSQEIFSNMVFPRNAGLEFEAKVRVRAPIADGLVSSFFTYMDKEMPTGNPVWSDEIDFEFLSNQINSPPESEGHRVFIATWNDFGEPGSDYNDCLHHWSANPVVPGLDLTEFNVFKIRWLPDRTEWYLDNTPEDNKDDDWLMIDTTTCALPDEPMTVRFNFWAATDGWQLPWDPDMQPADDLSEDIVCYYDVDYVVVRSIPEPVTLSLLALGSLALLRRKRIQNNNLTNNKKIYLTVGEQGE